jgi:hypothetical protein
MLKTIRKGKKPATKAATAPVTASTTSAATELMRKLVERKQPVMLTIQGEHDFVLRDTKLIQRLYEFVDHLEAIEGIRRGQESMLAGQGRPVSEVFEGMRRKHGIPKRA